MSCYIMAPDKIRRIGYALADIFSSCLYGESVSIDKSACIASGLMQSFMPACYSRNMIGFAPEKISEVLHRVNAKAYAARYKETEESTFPPPDKRRPEYSIRPAPNQLREMNLLPYYYHLMRLVDCWLYQTDEETTKNDPLRQKMNDFMNCLAREIVQNSPQYHCTLWDE